MKEGSLRVKNGRTELRVMIGGEQKSFYGKNEAEARKKLREYRKNLAGVEYSKEIFSNYIENWLTTYKYGKIKDSSYDILERVYQNQICGSAISQKRLKDITIDDIQYFIDDTASKYSESTLKKIIEIINPAIKRAVIEKKMAFNPLDFVAMPRKNNLVGTNEDADIPKIYLQDEIHKMTKACMGYYGTSTRNTNRYRYAPAYILLLNTGMRVGELAAMRWTDIDFEKRVIRINKTVSTIKNRGRFDESTKNVHVITTAKTKKSNRCIPMNETAYFILKELKKRQAETCAGSDYVISTKEGKPMLVRVLEQTFSRICEENHIEYKGLHALRHTFGSVMIRKGVDIKVISEILGHSTVQFTYDRYIHIINEMKAEAMDLMHVTDVKKYVDMI